MVIYILMAAHFVREFSKPHHNLPALTTHNLSERIRGVGRRTLPRVSQRRKRLRRPVIKSTQHRNLARDRQTPVNIMRSDSPPYFEYATVAAEAQDAVDDISSLVDSVSEATSWNLTFAHKLRDIVVSHLCRTR